MLPLLDDRCATIVAVAWYSGLRKGEIAALDWRCYTPAASEDDLGALEVRQSVWRGHVTEPKTDASHDAVPVIPALAEALDRWRRVREPGFGFGCSKRSWEPTFARRTRLEDHKAPAEESETTLVWLAWIPPRAGHSAQQARSG